MYFPNIQKKTGVNGGDATIVGTRIPIWSLVEMKNEGASNMVILQAFPSLKIENLENAWAYYKAFSTEIDAQIKAQEIA